MDMKRIEYNGAPISSRVDYWQKYWRKRVREIRAANLMESRIISPRFLLVSIISDVNALETPNKEAWRMYREIFGFWKQHKIFNLFERYCEYALKYWDEKPLLVSAICSQIISKMDNGDLFYTTINKLSDILSVDSVISMSERKLIHIYTDILIGELLSKGFVLDDISNMIYHPQVIMAETGDVIMAEDNICGYSKENYSSSQEYEAALTNYFHELTPKEKVQILNLYYKDDGIPATVLIRLEGIKGPLKLTINDIELYSINSESTDNRHISNDKHFWIETTPEGQHLVNAAVPILHKSIKTTLNKAIERVDEILSMIQIWNRFQYPITINKNKITIIISQDNIIEYSLTDKNEETSPEIKYLYSSNDASRYTKELTDYSDRMAKLRGISIKEFAQLSNSAKWITSAKKTNTASDKLLFSWFAIESLLKFSEKYRKTLTSKTQNGILDCVHTIIVPLINRNHFIHYKSGIINRFYYNSEIMRNRWNVPQEINTSLFAFGNTEYVEFFKVLPAIIESITEKSLIDDLIPFIEYYDLSGNGIKHFKANVKNELTYIYRLRNYIVHDAKLVDIQLPYYAERALFYASSLFNAILTVSTSNSLSLEDTIIKIYSDCDMFNIECQGILKSYALDFNHIPQFG